MAKEIQIMIRSIFAENNHPTRFRSIDLKVFSSIVAKVEMCTKYHLKMWFTCCSLYLCQKLFVANDKKEKFTFSNDIFCLLEFRHNRKKYFWMTGDIHSPRLNRCPPDRPAPRHGPKLSLLTELYYREVFFKGRILNSFFWVKNNIPL